MINALTANPASNISMFETFSPVAATKTIALAFGAHSKLFSLRLDTKAAKLLSPRSPTKNLQG